MKSFFENKGIIQLVVMAGCTAWRAISSSHAVLKSTEVTKAGC